MAKQRQLVASKTTLYRSLTQAREELELELLQTQQEKDTVDDQIAAAEANMAKLQAEVAKLDKAVAETQKAFAAAEREEVERRKEMDGCEAEMKKLTKARDAAKKVQ